MTSATRTIASTAQRRRYGVTVVAVAGAAATVDIRATPWTRSRTLFVTNIVRGERRSCQVVGFALVSPPGRSTRDRPAKPALSREAVVDAGLHVLRAEGIDA